MAYTKTVKKLWVLFSLAIGILPLLSRFRPTNRRKQQQPERLSPYHFMGNWSSDDGKMTLLMNENPSLSMNGKDLNLSFHKSNQDTITLKDSYGFRIQLTKVDDQKLNLFDEAEEKHYTFLKK